MANARVIPLTPNRRRTDRTVPPTHRYPTPANDNTETKDERYCPGKYTDVYGWRVERHNHPLWYSFSGQGVS